MRLREAKPIEGISRLMTTNKKFKNKRKKLRHSEYYGTQEMFDELYAQSKRRYRFNNLIPMIRSEENIKLAYRNIKRNNGSRTKGVNKTTIDDIEKECTEKIVKYIQQRIDNFQPHQVRRVFIEKDDGKKRPLGIPTMEDRLLQQCILQVLEPICEAKFHPHSYGFRPNRSQHHAIARVMYLVNQTKLNYVVDVDIKGFFDNVNHGKLLKQMWSLGIQDKNLICIISKLLKAEIKGEGIPVKGTPQGGILSPLLSNIVLNEFDWWISNQWETFETQKTQYSAESARYRALKTSGLKECFIVRYADDFKLLCRDYKSAQKIFIAVKKWLKERLGLEISPEKSKVINLRKNYSNFLGLKMKVKFKGTGKKKRKKYKHAQYVLKTKIADKSVVKIKEKLKSRIKAIKRKQDTNMVARLNATILGQHNYYKVATDVNVDFSKIAFQMSRIIYNRLRTSTSQTGFISETYKKLYGSYNFKVINIGKLTLFPIAGVKHYSPLCFTQKICNYTSEGRAYVHNNLKGTNNAILRYIVTNPVQNQSIEYNDNRISKFIAQKGLCTVTKEPLQISGMHCHHKKPKAQGGTDEYSNLIWVTSTVHRLIHATKSKTIEKYTSWLKLSKEQVKEINKLREKVGNFTI